MVEATPVVVVPDASLSGRKRKKVSGSNSHSWNTYFCKTVIQV